MRTRLQNQHNINLKDRLWVNCNALLIGEALNKVLTEHKTIMKSDNYFCFQYNYSLPLQRVQHVQDSTLLTAASMAMNS